MDNERMSAQEIATRIVQEWRLEHTPQAIMMTLVMLGVPMNTAQIMVVIRKYIDSCSENGTYHRK